MDESGLLVRAGIFTKPRFIITLHICSINERGQWGLALPLPAGVAVTAMYRLAPSGAESKASPSFRK